MSRSRGLLGTLAGFLIVIAGFAALLGVARDDTSPARGVTAAQVEAIPFGTPESRVRALLGEPEGSEERQTGEPCRYWRQEDGEPSEAAYFRLCFGRDGLRDRSRTGVPRVAATRARPDALRRSALPVQPRKTRMRIGIRVVPR